MRISDWSSDVCSSDLSQVEQTLRGYPDTSRQVSLLDRAAGVAADRAHIAPFAEDQRAGAMRASRAERGLPPEPPIPDARSVGKECVRSCRYRWSPDP